MGIVIQNIIIPESSSECSEWISYYDKLAGKFGSENAKVIWLKTWVVNGSTSCTTNPTFLAFTKKHDIDVSNAATRAVADISQIGGNILGLGKNLTKAFALGIPVVMGGVVLLILVFIVKAAKSNPKDLAKDALQLTPEGQALNLLKKL